MNRRRRSRRGKANPPSQLPEPNPSIRATPEVSDWARQAGTFEWVEARVAFHIAELNRPGAINWTDFDLSGDKTAAKDFTVTVVDQAPDETLIQIAMHIENNIAEVAFPSDDMLAEMRRHNMRF